MLLVLYDYSALWNCTEAKRIRTKNYSGLWNELCLNTSIQLIAWGEEACSLSAVPCMCLRCSSRDKTSAQGCQQCSGSWLQEEASKQEVGGPSISRKCNTQLCALHFPILLQDRWIPTAVMSLSSSEICLEFPVSFRSQGYTMWHLAFAPVKILSAYRRRKGTLIASL